MIYMKLPTPQLYRGVPCIMSSVFLNGNNLNNYDTISKSQKCVLLFSDDFAPLSLLF